MSVDQHQDRGGYRIAILSNHIFEQNSRKTSIHFLAESLSQSGHDVAAITVGVSPLRIFRQPHRYKGVLRAWMKRGGVDWGGARAFAALVALHPMNFRNAFLNRVFGGLAVRLGQGLPRSIADRIDGFDIFMIDSGSAVTYLPDLQRRFPSAIYVYNGADSLKAVGAPDYLLPLEEDAILNCDVVRSPSALLAKQFPAGANVHVVPHGIDIEPFDTCRTSPYAVNTINVVSVGSTLLDDDVIRTIARRRPDVLVHVFGLSAIRDMPGNVIFYGEVSFRETVAYIKYADVGLAAYRLAADSAYIAESSLKMMQYRYCAIPIMVPDLVPSSAGLATYRTGDPESIVAALNSALRMTGTLHPAQVLTWRGVSARLLEIIKGL